MLRRIILFALAIAGAACGGRGCVSDDRIHVIYRGPAQLDEKAAVTRDGTAIGFVEKVSKVKNYQRVTLLVRSAPELHVEDRFVVRVDTSGKKGFEVFPGGGEPLYNGAEVEADPKFSLRQHYADMAASSPGGITLPSGVYVPFPRGLTHETDPDARRAKKEARLVSRSLRLRDHEEFEVAPQLVAKYKDLQGRLDGLSKPEALSLLKTDGNALKNELIGESQAAAQRGDREAAKDAQQLARRIDQGLRRLEREVQRDERIGPRKERQRFVPPDFR